VTGKENEPHCVFNGVSVKSLKALCEKASRETLSDWVVTREDGKVFIDRYDNNIPHRTRVNEGDAVIFHNGWLFVCPEEEYRRFHGE